jgi:hypothetical protein
MRFMSTAACVSSDMLTSARNFVMRLVKILKGHFSRPKNVSEYRRLAVLMPKLALPILAASQFPGRAAPP